MLLCRTAIACFLFGSKSGISIDFSLSQVTQFSARWLQISSPNQLIECLADRIGKDHGGTLRLIEGDLG